ncbi:hypothetical protein QZH41_010957 [Actinostola sp. cb2023]|nr:hypothetical protein QZH41_010957 [Actinostola sp. cb2023]
MDPNGAAQPFSVYCNMTSHNGIGVTVRSLQIVRLSKNDPFSFMEGGEGIASTEVQDAFSCLLFCLRELKCVSINFARNPDEIGRHLCTIYDSPVDYGGFKLVPSELYDFYSKPPAPKSCSNAKSLGYHESKDYVIDPDGPNGAAQPFSVYCNMTSHNGIGVTVVSHNSEARTLVDGCEANGCYRRDVVYDGISSDQLRALTSISTHCEQYIKYECVDAMLLDHYGGSQVSWLVSRDGRQMKYWGGASRDSGLCACGVTQSCAKNARCNCDANEGVWREDSGLLNYKEDLPVISLRYEHKFGDVGSSSELGYHTLGKLRCYGQLVA